MRELLGKEPLGEDEPLLRARFLDYLRSLTARQRAPAAAARHEAAEQRAADLRADLAADVSRRPP